MSFKEFCLVRDLPFKFTTWRYRAATCARATISFFLVFFRLLCPLQGSTFDGCCHLVGWAIVERRGYAAELQVLGLFAPSAGTGGIEFASRTEVNDEALLQHLGNTLHAQLQSHLSLCLMQCGVVVGLRYDVFVASCAIGDYSGCEALSFCLRIHATRLCDIQFQLCNNASNLRVNTMFIRY